MTNYRRNRTEGATFFFTVNLWDRQKPLLTENIDVLRGAFRDVRARHPFQIDGIVVLPDHLHTIWTLVDGDADYSKRWRLIKGLFSRCLPSGEKTSLSRDSKGERGIWQRRYWEHTIRDDRDFAVHMDYIHYNPVKHGLVVCPSAWPYSSFHRLVKLGVYPADWAGDVSKAKLNFGER
jgi:putative transposase